MPVMDFQTGFDYYVGLVRPLKVGEEWRQPGEAIPEAAGWPNVQHYLNRGEVVAVPHIAEPEVAARDAGRRAQPAQLAALQARVAELEAELGRRRTPEPQAAAAPPQAQEEQAA